MVTFASGSAATVLLRWLWWLPPTVMIAGSRLMGQASMQDLPAPYGPIVTYGPVGLFVVLYLTGQMVTKRELQREIEARQKAEAKLETMADKVMSDLVPLITEVNGSMVPTMRQVSDAVTRYASEQTKVVAELMRLSERMDRIDQVANRK